MILAITLLAFAAQANPRQEPYPCDYIQQNVWDPKFTPGQKWSYSTGLPDVGSTLTIVEVDNVPTVGFVVHILVEPVTLRVDHVSGRPIDHLIHGSVEQFAIQRDSLAASITNLVDNVSIPILNSYSSYRAHCVALTYTTSVADTLTLIQANREAKHCEDLAKTMKRLPPPCKTQPPSAAPPSTPVFPSTPITAPPSPAAPAPLQPVPTAPPGNKPSVFSPLLCELCDSLLASRTT